MGAAFLSPVLTRALRASPRSPHQERTTQRRQHATTMRAGHEQTGHATRRVFLYMAALTASTAVLPGRAKALTREEAEDEARLAYASIPTLSRLIDEKNYDAFRSQLRSGAMSRVRASCTALYRSFDASDRRAKVAERCYRGLIRAVEAADYAALSAARGGADDVAPLVRAVGERFDEFLGAVE